MASPNSYPGINPSHNLIAVPSERMDQLSGPLAVPAPGGEVVPHEQLAEVVPIRPEAPAAALQTSTEVTDDTKAIDKNYYGIYKNIILSEGQKLPSVQSESSEYIGRHRAEAQHRAPEGDYVGRHRAEAQHRAPEANTSSDRLLVRAANRLASIADKFAGNMSARRTTKETAKDTLERGRMATRKVGASIVDSALAKSESLRDYIRTGIKAEGTQVVGFRDIVGFGADTARAHKDALVATVKNRAGIIAEGAQRNGERVTRAARVGKEAVRVSGLVTLGAGITAAEMGRDYVKDKKNAAKDYAANRLNDVRAEVADISAGNKEYNAQKAARKAAKAQTKAADRNARAQAARAHADKLDNR